MQGRLLRADLIMTWKKIFNGKSALSPDILFTLNPSARRGHPLKLFVPRTNLDISRRSFAVRVVSEWNNLSDGTVTATTIDSFKRQLQHDLDHRLYEFA